MRGAKLITVNCNNCNRKVHATIKQFLDGLNCPSCGLPVALGVEEQINQGKSFLHKSTCVNCGHSFDLPFQHSFKHMAECPSCNSLFIRENLILDDSTRDRESEAFRLLETLYPSLPNNLNDDLGDTTPASEQELQFLRDLNIKGNAPSARTVQRIAKTIFDSINLVMMTFYNAVLYFPYELRSKIYLEIAKSPLLRAIYFDKVVTKEQLEPIIRRSLDDEDLYQALCASFDVASFEIAVVYIINYAKIIFDKDLDDFQARILALKCFARGIGWEIRHSGYFIFSQDENRVKSVTRLSPAAMKSFYTRKNRVNETLVEVFRNLGWEAPKAQGCLSVIVFLLLAGALLMLR